MAPDGRTACRADRSGRRSEPRTQVELVAGLRSRPTLKSHGDQRRLSSDVGEHNQRNLGLDSPRRGLEVTDHEGAGGSTGPRSGSTGTLRVRTPCRCTARRQRSRPSCGDAPPSRTRAPSREPGAARRGRACARAVLRLRASSAGPHRAGNRLARGTSTRSEAPEGGTPHFM